MSWAKHSNGKFVRPTRSPDFVWKENRFWFKEMMSFRHGCTFPIMECPLSGSIMVYGNGGSGWYCLSDKVREQYDIWITDNILLGDEEKEE